MSTYIDRLVEDDMPAEVWEPPTCENSPGECDWSEEQEGYEEQARPIWVCHTHGTERRASDRPEIEE